jgi:DNA-binding transcriptional LysR family regulator
MRAESFADELAIFADVAAEGSFSGAARRRGVSPSSVVRRIDALEVRVGAPLFVRSTRSLTLTAAGQALLVRARRILDELADTIQEVASFSVEVRGLLRVASLPTFGKRYVVPAVASLAQTHPHLRVELDLTERVADPIVERFDAVIRIGRLPDSTLIVSQLAVQRRVLCASPAYLARSSVPATRDDLTAHRLLDKAHGADLLRWADVLGRPLGQHDVHAVFRCDDFDTLRQAALDGIGIAYLPDWVVGTDINRGALVQLFPLHAAREDEESGVYLLRALPKAPPALRTFEDALRRVIGSPPSWRVGESG